jgi:lysozyme
VPEVLGIDVSNHQKMIDWPRVGKALGPGAMAWIKVSEGATFDDRYGIGNLLGAASAGLRLGAYHMLSSRDAAAQVEQYAYCLGPYGLDGVVSILDVEVPGTGHQAQAWVDAFTRRWPGRRLLVYTNRGLWRLAGGPDHLDGPVGLWHAGIRDGVYSPYSGSPATIWANAKTHLSLDHVAGMVPVAVQYTDRATVPGITGPVDASAWLGLTAALDDLATPPGGDVQLTDRVGLGTGTRTVLKQITGQDVTEMEVGDLLQRVLGNVLALNSRPGIDVEDLAAQLAAETDAEVIKAALLEVLPEIRLGVQ